MLLLIMRQLMRVIELMMLLSLIILLTVIARSTAHAVPQRSRAIHILSTSNDGSGDAVFSCDCSCAKQAAVIRSNLSQVTCSHHQSASDSALSQYCQCLTATCVCTKVDIVHLKRRGGEECAPAVDYVKLLDKSEADLLRATQAVCS
jgi:hypothetical protein